MKLITDCTAGSIEKEVLTEGIYSRKPNERSKCRFKIHDVEYANSSIYKLLRSEYLESQSEETSIILGDACSKVDELVERVIQTMLIEEESLVKITLRNPEESVSICFKIKLLDCDLHKPIWEWTAKEKYKVALGYKEIGVVLHKSSRIVEAFRKFSRACKVLITLEPMEDNEEMGDELRKEVDDLRKILYNNMAECHLMRGNYELAILLCDKVLGREEKNVKALYRRAVAHEKLKDYENAMNYMDKVVVLEPRNSVAKERAIIYRKKVGQANKNYDDIVKKMFKV